MRIRLGLPTCAVACAWLAVAGATASADVFGPISLVSEGSIEGASGVQQATYADHAVISANGEYVAFDGSFDGTTGVWRRDLATGAVEQVAPGDSVLPSISSEGRYVSFTTKESLLPEDTNEGPDVYVRDMDLSAQAPGAFTLASAITVEGKTQGLTYEYATAAGSEGRRVEEENLGSVAAGRSAMSANGEKVAFVTTVASDLAGPRTPKLQVAVRNLRTGETQLVSALANPATGVPELNAEGQDMPVPVEEGKGAVYGQGAFPNPSEGASISADGTTVTWMGQQIGKQARVLAKDIALKPSYSEPLWRRIDEGPQAPIRRVTGGSDPANPACANSGETEVSTSSPSLSDPCQGPFVPSIQLVEPGIWTRGAEAEFLPQLSENGDTVAFLSNARYLPGGEEFLNAESSDDLYVAEMGQEGLTRVAALRRLSEVASGKTEDPARSGAILDFAVSPSGSQVAFTTLRTVFPLGSPAYVSAPLAVAGMSELYDADLSDDTLTRVTHGFQSEAEPSEQPHREAQAGHDPYSESDGAFSPSFSKDGNTLAFSSTASNLVFGDGSPHPLEGAGAFDGSEAFLITRKEFSAVSTETYISPAPVSTQPVPAWQLGVTALSRKDGSVVLEVEVPGAGTLTASAQSAVAVSSSDRASRARKAQRRRRGRAANAKPHVVVRTVASRGVRLLAGGLQTLTLRLAGPYASLASASGGLSATATLVFAAPGHPTLRQGITVLFLRTEPVRAKRSAKKGRSASKHRATRGAPRR